MTKPDLKKFLIDKGFSESEVMKMKISELRDLFDECTSGELASTALETVSEVEDTVVDEEINNKDEIDSTHPNWTQYVLGKLRPDELDNGNPKIDGLRRISEVLIGEIVEETCSVSFAPCHDNNMTVGVHARVLFNNGKIFEALADATSNNLSPGFKVYLTAMADTRAKARAFRNALKIRTVVAEEIGDPNTTFGSDTSSAANIQQAQVTAIRLALARLRINKVDKILEVLDIKYAIKDNNPDINSLSYEDAIKVIRQLNDMKMDQVPEDWR